MADKRDRLVRLGALGAATLMATCARGGDSNERTGEAAARDSSENLLLVELTNECTANGVQDVFRVTNNDTASIRLSDITIKLWVNETTANAVLASVTDKGCVAAAGQGDNCGHSVGATKVNVAATPHTCAGEEANWEVSITTNDHSSLDPGESWTHISTLLSLSKNKAFTPGPAGWYSSCVGSAYAPSAHTAVYYQGGLVRAAAGIPPACVTPSGTQTVGGATPPAIVAGTVPLVGPLPAATPIMLGISLPLQNPTGAQALLAELYDPTSDQYGKFLQPADFGNQFGASAGDYAAVVNYMTAAGLTVAQTFSNRTFLVVTGTAATVENAFNTTLNQYQRPDGTIFYAPANDPSLNLTVPLAFVAGLDSYARPTPQDGSGLSYSTCPVGGGVIGSGTGYMGQDFRKIYLNNPTALLGDNVTAAVVAFDAFTPTGGGFTSDPDRYAAATAQGPLHVSQIACNLNPAIVVSGGEPEVAADVSLIYAMAPHAQINVYEFPSTSNHPAGNPYDGSATGFQAIMHRILEDHSANVIVNSWTWQSGTAAPDPTVANTMLQAALQGMSFFQAAGDVGRYTNSGFCAVTLGACTDNTECTFGSNPADTCNFAGAPEPIINSPQMTVVGATLLPGNGSPTSTEGQNGTCASAGTCASHSCDGSGKCETGDFPWDASNYATHAYRSTGGGFVQGYTGVLGTVYPGLLLPSYQVDVNTLDPTTGSQTGTSSTNTLRMIPDVSIVGDQLTTYWREDGSTQSCAGGTSYSAALWGGVGLLIHQKNQQLGQPALGMANFALYNLKASATDPTASLYDVPGNVGSNPDFSGFNASTQSGYDLVTGLGTPRPALVTAGTVLPPQSCQSGSNLTLLVNKATGDVIAYTPVGSWEQIDPVTNAGVRWVPIESTSGNLAAAQGVGSVATVPAIGVVNTCAADSSGAGNVVCTENGGNVWLINGTESMGVINDSTSGTGALSLATTAEGYSGGNCTTCNVAVDPLSHKAYVSLGTALGAELQVIDLPTAFSTAATTPLTPGGVSPSLINLNQFASSEAIATDTTRGAVLSANENGFFQFINATNPNLVYSYDLNAVPGLVHDTPWEFDATAEDCSTGIAVATVESDGAGKEILFVDLKQAAFDNTISTWATGQCTLNSAACATDTQCANHCDTAHGQCILSAHACATDTDCPVVSTCATPFHGVAIQTFPELDSDDGEFGGVAVASDGSHLGLVATEFGGSQIVVFQLMPDGTPAVKDYAVAVMPNNPDGTPWVMGFDPHTIGIYTSPNNSAKVYGVMQNNVSTGSRYLAVIDINVLMSTALNPRTGGTHAVAGTPSSCCSVPQGTCLAPSAVPNCVVKFVPN